MNNLNTHTPGSLYEAFDPTEAKRLADKLEIHYTPKHASWLNMAETELSVLTRQCLDRRIPDQETLVSETTAWMHTRNVSQTTIDWRFTTAMPASSSSVFTRQSCREAPLGAFLVSLRECHPELAKDPRLRRSPWEAG
jgi:DDE superfamily endonuclease